MNLQTVTLTSPTTTVTPTNHIVVVDCSGSMSYDLPKIRTHLKNKIPTMVRQDDTLTIIWFSGRDQYGVLFEGAEVNGLTDLSSINATIDRYLTPVGLTGFKQPLQEVLAVIKRMSAMQHSMLFMSDGYDNTWGSADIMSACTALNDHLVSAAFVEYGNYSDHDMLLKMAEEVGGSLVQASDFSKYAYHLDNIKHQNFGKRIQVDAPATATGFEFVVGHTDTGFVIAKPQGSKISLPSNTKSYSYFGEGSKKSNTTDKDACAVVAALIQRGQSDVAMDLAAKIGDVELYRTLENAFSRQDLAKAAEKAENLSVGTAKLFGTAPKSTSLVQDPNKFSVLELLMELSDRDGNSLVLTHPEFSYTSIGAKRPTLEIDGFTPKFSDNAGAVVAEIANLVFDGERPNASILVRRLGTVSLPDNEYGFGNSFNSYIWRNYAIVRDGVVNVGKLPVMLSKASYDAIISRGIELGEYKVGKVFVIDLTSMPVINRSMVKAYTADSLFKLAYKEYALEAQQKYVKTLIEKPAVGAKFSEQYGEEAALFLKKYGVTEGGFGPKTGAGEESDVYIAKALTVKMAGMSNIPTVDAVKKAVDAGKKLTPSQQTMDDAMGLVDSTIAAGATAEEVFAQIKSALKTRRNELVKMKFSVIIGRKWFSDSTGYDDNVRSMDFGLGKLIECEVNLCDKLV